MRQSQVLYWAQYPCPSAIFLHIAQAWQCFNWFKAFLVNKLFVLTTFSDSKVVTHVTNNGVFSIRSAVWFVWCSPTQMHFIALCTGRKELVMQHPIWKWRWQEWLNGEQPPQNTLQRVFNAHPIIVQSEFVRTHLCVLLKEFICQKTFHVSPMDPVKVLMVGITGDYDFYYICSLQWRALHAKMVLLRRN